MNANTTFYVFPNPVTHAVNIQNNSTQNIKFTLYNSSGEIILTEFITYKTGTIDLSKYSNDFYYYRASIGDRIIRSGRILKQ